MDKKAFIMKYSDELGSAKEQLQAKLRKLQFLEMTQEPTTGSGSRLGGPLFWPRGEPIPTDSSGKPMILAAQINFEETKVLPDFPKSGLLQLFLANDINERGITFLREYRNDGDYPLRNGDGFKVVFHHDTNNLVETELQPPQVDYPICSPGLVSNPRKIRFSDATEQLPPMSHWQGSIIYERFDRLPEAENSFGDVFDVLSSETWDEQLPTRSYLGGYACPLQADQRRFFEEFQQYDTCIMNFGELPMLDLPDMNFAVLIAKANLLARQFEDTVMIADTD